VHACSLVFFILFKHSARSMFVMFLASGGNISSILSFGPQW
jgi:hypothetical protein